MRYKRFEIPELKILVPVNEKVEKQKIQKREQDFFHKHILKILSYISNPIAKQFHSNPLSQYSMENYSPQSLEQLRKIRKPIRNIAIERKQQLSRLDKAAIWITDHVGTMGFFILIFIWTSVWLSWNTLAPQEIRFDPYPAFVLWLFLSNMIQIFLMPLIMIGQNLQSAHAEARAEADFEVNTKAEREIEAILEHLENQNKLILQIVKHLEKIGAASK